MIVASFASWHEDHELALDAIQQVRILPAHVLVETASVLTRLPRGLAQPISVVASLLLESFPEDPLTLSSREHWSLLDTLSDAGIRGGAIYDCLVGATARSHGAALLTLDSRAASAYRTLDVEVHWLVSS